jgi:hypothetical protein
MTTKNEFKLIKSDNKFYLENSSGLREEVTGNVDESYQKLWEKTSSQQDHFKAAGLENELNPASLPQRIGKRDYLAIGTLLMLPMIVGFLLFTFVLTKQITKLTNSISKVLNPVDERQARSELRFKRSLDKYRPYLFEMMKVWEEEKAKVEAEKKSGK